MKDLMAAEAGIVPPRPFDGVQHTPYGIQQGTMAKMASQPMSR